jgi:hypothetical protein
MQLQVVDGTKLNGFQPKATWVREGKQNGTRDESLKEWKDKFYGLTTSRVLNSWDRAISLPGFSSFSPTMGTKTIAA